MALKHNKKKNSLIIYEQLLTLAARLASQKKQNEFDFVVEIAKKHFSPATNIGKEKKILQSLTDSFCRSEQEAISLISECLEEYKVIDSVKLEAEKVGLINEINSKIGADLFKIPIKNYKLFASAQILVNETKNNFAASTPVERNKIKNLLKENFMKKEAPKEDVAQIDSVTYKILVNKFNKKYGSFINEDQKQILSLWIKYLITENEQVLLPVLQEKVTKIKKIVSKALSEKSNKAADYYEDLKEAEEVLKNKKIEVLNESVVYEVMRFYDLCDDLEKSE
jgi:RNase P protein component